MQTEYQLVRVFNLAEQAQGNQAAIFDNDQIDLHHEQNRMSADVYKQKGVSTACFISQVGNACYDVHCFNGSHEIQCCGHGMIAAAKTVFARGGLSNIIINENITASHTMDDTGHDVVLLNLPRLSAQVQPVPNWVSTVIKFDGEKLLPSKAAVSEENDGYLLLEFKPVLALDVFCAMKIDLKKICENTQRAIVVVQHDQNNKHLYMRYFAPQYGVAEDIATGSVMRFVGDYIEKNYHHKNFDVSQCSSLGGFMKIECKAENIIITANVSMETNQ